MIKSSWRLPRRESSLILQTCTSRRLLAVTVGKIIPDTPTSHGRSLNDFALRQIFDSANFWHDFSQKSASGTSKFHCGLLQNHFLIEPRGFFRYAEVIKADCQQIAEDVLSASSVFDYIAIPRKLDRLSDSLCRVLDIADFVRAVHPDVRFRNAAIQSYTYLFEYMNVLNTTPGLERQLQRAVSDPEVAKVWSEEERTVAHILLRDFARSAIHLPRDKRDRFIELSSEVKHLGGEFVDNTTPKRSSINFDVSRLKGMDPLLLAKMRSGFGKVSLPLDGETPYAALCSVQDEDVRQQIYLMGRQAPKDQIHRLERLLQARAEIARLSGYESYAHMSLSDKLARSPEAVNSFLTALSVDNNPTLARELAQIRQLKEQDYAPPNVQPWDIMYYRNRFKVDTKYRSRIPDFMAAYFSLGTVMQGLSRLFTRLHGIYFIPRETSPGETWSSDVRRLDVMHETEGHVAVLYCDLFTRVGKTHNPTHFTLRCSRLISSSEISEAHECGRQINDGMVVSPPNANKECFQLPVIALVCDFLHPSDQQTPALLAFQDVKTLFHEMGHAIHSILGRTSLQIVSGTRCPTDLAELPSVLMEYFASDASVLALFARHWETDDPLPYQMVENALQVHQRGQGLQMETQILFSLLDQAYHSPLPLTMGDRFDSSKIFFDIYDKHSSVCEPRETSAQGLFGHLVEYGGTYYSYLFDRAIAGRLWSNVFRNGKDKGGLDREAGERYKEEILKWGGGRSGWACIGGLLRDERLRDGGNLAMEEVGRWGVHG